MNIIYELKIFNKVLFSYLPVIPIIQVILVIQVTLLYPIIPVTVIVKVIVVIPGNFVISNIELV